MNEFVTSKVKRQVFIGMKDKKSPEAVEGPLTERKAGRPPMLLNEESELV